MSDKVKKETATDTVAVTTEKLVKVRALNSLCGIFLLPYSEGHVFEINAAQAAEIVESKNGEYVTENDAE